MIKRTLKEQVAQATRLFWQKGLSTGRDGGDVSLRDPEAGLIYVGPRTDKNYQIANWGEVKGDDIAVIDEEGKVADASHGRLPTVEAPMHLLIYRSRPEINAIIHSHAVYSSAFAVTGQNIPLTLAESAVYASGEVICAKYGKVGSRELAENVVMALGKKKKAALLRNHGAVCVGTDLEDAFIVSDFLENTAKVVILGRILGQVIPIKTEDIFDDSLAEMAKDLF